MRNGVGGGRWPTRATARAIPRRAARTKSATQAGRMTGAAKALASRRRRGRRLVRRRGQGEDVVAQSNRIRAPRTPLERRLDQLVGQEIGSVHRRSTARARSSERRRAEESGLHGLGWHREPLGDLGEGEMFEVMEGQERSVGHRQPVERPLENVEVGGSIVMRTLRNSSLGRLRQEVRRLRSHGRSAAAVCGWTSGRC